MKSVNDDSRYTCINDYHVPDWFIVYCFVWLQLKCLHALDPLLASCDLFLYFFLVTSITNSSNTARISRIV